MALVSVLWAMSILSLIAASMMSAGSLSAQMERNALKRAQAGRIADSAIALGILGLLDPRPEKRWRVDGVAQDAAFLGVPLKISIQDEFGLIDLNQAGVELFRGLFRSAGADEDEARRLAERVIEWRGTARNGQRTVAADYGAAGLSHAPRRAPFQSADELGLVLGVTPEIFARIAPALTVHSQQPSLDRRVAPREALLALPGMSARQAEAILAERRSGVRGVGGQGLPLGAGVIDPSLAVSGRAFTITAAFAYRESATERKAAIRLAGSSARPYMELN